MLFLDAIVPFPFYLAIGSIGFLIIFTAVAALVVTTMIIIALFQKFSKKKEKDRPSE